MAAMIRVWVWGCAGFKMWRWLDFGVGSCLGFRVAKVSGFRDVEVLV